MRFLSLLFTLLWPAVVFAQATTKAPNTLGTVTAPALTDQLYVCQTSGGCDTSGTKQIKQETAQQLLSLGACPTGMTCVAPPTGVAATDTANIQAAVNTGNYAIVLLLPGTYKTNADIVITNRNVSVMGWPNSWGAGLGSSVSPYPSNTNVDCSAIPHTAGDFGGCFVIKNQNVHLSGFRIFANEGSGENCISIGDSGVIIDGNMVLDWCWTGIIVDTGVGTTTGYALNTFINHVYMPYPYQFGIYCNSSCTDFMFGPDIWTEIAGGNYNAGGGGGPVNMKGAVYVGPNAIHGRIFSNFFGDGHFCLTDNGALDIAFVNNECGNSQALYMSAARYLQFVGNSGYWNYNDGSPAIVVDAGNSYGIQITNNIFYPSSYTYGSCFQAYSGAMVSTAVIANNYCDAPALYADTFSDSVFDPWVNPHPYGGVTVANSSGTFAAPDWQAGFDVILPLYHGANTLPNPVYTAFGQKGTFSIQQSPVGGDTFGTLGTQYLNSPASLSTTAYATDIYPWQTNAQGNIIFGVKLASLTPNANLLTGGNAMTSGWTTSNVAATGGWTPNSVADPVGGTTGANLIEDNTSNYNKGVTQAVSGFSASTAYTCSVWYSPGTSGNRNVAIKISDASFSNYGMAIFNRYDGSNVGTSGVGIIAHGNAGTLPGGYIRPYLTISLPTAPGNVSLYLATNILNYLGDGSSGGYLWGPTCRLGTAP